MNSDGPKNFWDDLTCKGFNVFVRPIEPRSSNFDSNNNNNSSKFYYDESTKNSKKDYNNNRNYGKKTHQYDDEQLLHHQGEADGRTTKNNIICPCCGHNLGSQWTLVHLRDDGNCDYNDSNYYYGSHFNKKGQKEATSTIVKQNYGINNNSSSTNSNGLPVTCDHAKHYHRPLTEYYSQDFNSRTIGTQWPTSTICDSNYQLVIPKPKGGYRNLSELLKVDKDQSSPNPETFQNDWTRNKRIDGGDKLYRNNSSQTFEQKITNGSKFSQSVWHSSLKNDNNYHHPPSPMVIPNPCIVVDDENRPDSKMIQAEQNNSRTYLREHRVVQSMRNCWEHYLQLQLNGVSEENHYYYYDYWRDSLNRSSTIKKQGEGGGSDMSKSFYHDKRDEKRDQELQRENKFWTSVNKISDEVSLKSDKVTKSHHQIGSKKSLDSGSNSGRPGGGSGGERKRTFEEIRIEFEKSAIEYVERIEKEENITKKMEEPVILSMQKTEASPKKIVTSTTETTANTKDTPSPEEKVKNWMDKNDKISRQNSSNDHSLHQNQVNDIKKAADPQNPKKEPSEGEQVQETTTKKDINFIQLATMSGTQFEYQQHLPCFDNRHRNKEQVLETQKILDKDHHHSITNKPIMANNSRYKNGSNNGKSNASTFSKKSKNGQFHPSPPPPPPPIPSLDESQDFETARGSK